MFLEFVYNKYYDPDGKIALALQSYVRIGQEIRRDPDFINSPLGELEQIAKDAENYFKKENVKEKYNLGQDSVLRYSFVALAAPSYEGKTQSAFVFKDVRSLYFIANTQLIREDNPRTQPIYYNYKSISDALLEYAELDYEKIKNDGKSDGTGQSSRNPGFTEKDLEFIKVSRSYLNVNHRNTKFRVLGLFKELVLDAKKHYDSLPESDRCEWMEYHANRKNLLIQSTSIAELEEDRAFFKGYDLFLDEFSGDIEKVFIRNIARTIGLRCIVANTNAIIANLTGKVQADFSRESDADEVWSIVFTRLNPVSRNIMKNIYKIDELKQKLSGRYLEFERRHFEYFMNLLSGELGEIKIVRPGLMGAVIESLRNIIERTTNNGTIRILDLINEVIDKVSQTITRNKGQIRRSFDGILANLSLYSLHSYQFDINIGAEIGNDIDIGDKKKLKKLIKQAKKQESENREKIEKLEKLEKTTNNRNYHRKLFLADHLYYLINPVNRNNPLFLIYPPKEENGSMQFDFKREGQTLKDEWKYEYTFFDYDDVLTALACMSITSKKTILANLNAASAKSSSDPTQVADSSNPVAVSLNGNHLEVFTAFAIIEASHFVLRGEFSKFTLSGQNGLSFIQNILSNSVKLSNFNKHVNASLILEHKFQEKYKFDLKGFLSNMTVPFLCPFNSPIPVFLDELSSSVPANESIYVGTYLRTENTRKIDAVFDVYFNQPAKSLPKKPKTEQKNTSSFKAVIECKHWATPVSSGEVTKILKKALAIDQCRICFIFCTSITHNENEYAALFSLCNEKKILIYRFYTDQKEFPNFFTAPYYQKLEPKFNTKKPELVCFVFELANINKYML